MNNVYDEMISTRSLEKNPAFANEEAYLRLLSNVLTHGRESADRTGTGTLKLWGPQIEFDMAAGFPLLTTKKLHFKSILHELLWFLKGDTNIAYLKENGVTIWDEWADEKGELGPVYGHQWRSWPGQLMQVECGAEADTADTVDFDLSDTFEGETVEIGFPYYDACVFNRPIDQIREALTLLRTDPDSRRIIVTAWNPADLPKQKLPPCHCFFQFGTFLDEKTGKRTLNIKVYQRSADSFLGVPYNIASYAILLQLFAEKLGMIPGRLILTFGDVHLYKNHVEQAALQLTRAPVKPPVLRIDANALSSHDVCDMPYEAFSLEGYNPQGVIKADVSV